MFLLALVTRYIAAELSKTFVTVLACLAVLLTLVGVAQEAVRQGLGPLPLVRLTPYVLTNSLCFALPGAILFSVCSVYGRMSAENEIVALKSLGISPAAVVRPAIVLGFLASLAGVCLIDAAFSWGYQGVQRVVLESLEEIAYGVLRTQRTYRAERCSISVAGVEGACLLRPTITYRPPGDARPVTITASTARLWTDAKKNSVSIAVTDGWMEVGGEVTLRFPDTLQQEIPLAGLRAPPGEYPNPSHMMLCDIPPERIDEQQRLRSLQQTLAATEAIHLMFGGRGGSTEELRQERRHQLANAEQRLHRLNVEPYRRWASGFTCLCFVMVGVPLAIRLKSADYFTTFGICFLPLLLAYYPLFAFALDRAKSGALPPCATWLGNVACLLVGAGLYWKVRRY